MIYSSCGFLMSMGKYIDAGIILETPFLIMKWNQCVGLG